MYKIALVCLVSLLYFCGLVKAQTKNTIVITARDEKILLPVIEKILDTITYDGKKVFDMTTNLNEVFSTIENEKSHAAAFSFLTNKNLELSHQDQLIYDKLAKEISNYTYFLNIHINKIGILLEIQLYLYKTNELGNRKSVPLKNIVIPSKVSKPEYFTSFIVDLAKNDYDERIYWEVTKMLPKFNQIPRAVISSGLSINKEYFIGTNDTLQLSSEYSNDRETSRKNLSFSWWRKKIVSDSGYLASSKLLVSSSKDFFFSSSSTADVQIYLLASDGATKSLEDSVLIHINHRPKIKVHDTNLRAISYNSVMWPQPEEDVVFVADVTNGSNRIQDLKISRNLSDSIAMENRKKKSLNYKLFKSVYSAFGQMYANRPAPPPPVLYSVDTTSSGYLIRLNGKDIFEYPKGSFNISVSNHRLMSETVKLSYNIITYQPISLYMVYEKFFYSQHGDQSQNFSVQEKSIVRLGLAYDLLGPGLNSWSIYSTTSFGSWKKNMVNGIDLETPLESSLNFKPRNLPLFIGFYGRLLTLKTESNQIPLRTETTQELKLSSGFTLGFYLHPTKKIPVALTASTSGQFVPIRSNGIQINYSFWNVGLKYYLKE